MHGSMAWRETPKSHDFVSVAAPKVLPGYVRVDEASADNLVLTLQSTEQRELLSTWTSQLPAHVLPLACLSTGQISHVGKYVCLNKQYAATQKLPSRGQLVRVRLACHVERLGSMRRAQLSVTDVSKAGIPENGT